MDQHIDMLQELLAAGDIFNKWEVDFLESLSVQHYLTGRLAMSRAQAETLEKLYGVYLLEAQE